jgi:hypothetical protein
MIVAQTNGTNCIKCFLKNLTMIFTSRIILKKIPLIYRLIIISHYDLIT